MIRYMFALAAALMALPSLAHADGCLTSTVATLLVTNGGVCSIGNLTFDFTNYVSGGSNLIGAEYAPGSVIFTPTANGFNLSGNFSSSSSLESVSDWYLGLSYTISTTDDMLTGGTVTINGASFSLPPGNPPGAGAAISVDGAGDIQVGESATYGAYSVSNNFPGGTPALLYSSSVDFAAVPSMKGWASIKTTVENASSSFTSADFEFRTSNVTEGTNLPEPSILLSLLTGLGLTIIPIHRLQRKR